MAAIPPSTRLSAAGSRPASEADPEATRGADNPATTMLQRVETERRALRAEAYRAPTATSGRGAAGLTRAAAGLSASLFGA